MTKPFGDLVREHSARLWAQAATYGARPIALYAFAGGVVYGALKVIFVGEPVLRSAGLALGLPAGAFALAYISAPLVGLIGWLTRGTFNMRPLFIVLVAQTLTVAISTEVLVPLAFQPLIGLPFHVVVPVLIGLGSTLVTYASLMTLISHRFAYGMFRVAVVIGILSMLGGYRTYLAPGREAFMASVFAQRDSGLARAMDSRRFPSSVLENDFKVMSKAFGETPR